MAPGLHTLDELLDGMASPDPQVRDGWAYAQLAEGIASGRFAGERALIRERMVAQLTSDRIEARAFAPLVLSWLVRSASLPEAGDRAAYEAGDRAAYEAGDRAAYEAFARWYAVETDTRGFDPQLGWLHAVAHGADYLAAAVKAGIAEPGEALGLAARRLVVRARIWEAGEDARLAAAMVAALARVQPDEPAGTRWLAVVHGAMDEVEPLPPPPPPWLRNVSMTIALLYAALAEMPCDGDDVVAVPCAAAVRAGLVGVLSRMQPWVIQPR